MSHDMPHETHQTGIGRAGVNRIDENSARSTFTHGILNTMVPMQAVLSHRSRRGQATVKPLGTDEASGAAAERRLLLAQINAEILELDRPIVDLRVPDTISLIAD
jgi:hypothetical protein